MDWTIGNVAVVVGALIGVALLLVLAFALLIAGVTGAIRTIGYALAGALQLFGFAAEQGFLGIAAYVACWVFMAPVMLIGCIVVGYLCAAHVAEQPSSAPRVITREAQMAIWAEEDRRYEELRQQRIQHSKIRDAKI
jgi:hypothetical protein